MPCWQKPACASTRSTARVAAIARPSGCAPRGNGFHGNACFGKALHDGPSAYRFPRVSYEEAATDAGLCVSPGSRGVRSRSPAQCLTPHCRSRPANPFPTGDLGMTARFSRPAQPAVGKAYPILWASWLGRCSNQAGMGAALIADCGLQG